MSITVEISDSSKLRKAKDLLGVKTESETIEIALEKIVEEFETKREGQENEKAIEVFDLNYAAPKKVYEIEAEFEFVGRGKPLPFDFSDVIFENDNEEK